jgi:hypothetical protein
MLAPPNPRLRHWRCRPPIANPPIETKATRAKKEEKTIRGVFMLVALLARSWVSILAFFCAAIARTQTEPRTYGKQPARDRRPDFRIAAD